MNNKIYFSPVLLLCFIAFSCQKVESQLEEIQPGVEKNDSVLLTYEALVLENNMQWASFIVAEILYDDINEKYRDDFIALIDDENTIELSDLIGENAIFPNFRMDFREIFFLYYNDTHLHFNCDGRPNASEDKPFQMAAQTTNPFQVYREALLGENCVELYFPNDLGFTTESPSGRFTITSTAHPMTVGDGNAGYRRGICENYVGVQEVTVNDSYLSDYNNIIVARPFRRSKCKYSEYDFEFTEFLSN